MILNKSKFALLVLLLYFYAGLSYAEQYKYCFKVNFSDNENIKSATVVGFDHPWWKLSYPRETHRVTITDYAQQKCWQSDQPEMGIEMAYTLKEPQGIAYEFNCRKAPDNMVKYKAKTWNLYIREKHHDEKYPIDCKIR